MLLGGWAEHAVLLVNFFLYLEIPSWLVLGNAVPQGRTGWVLTHYEGTYLLWDPLSGAHYHTDNSLIPLTHIWALSNHENVSWMYQFLKKQYFLKIYLTILIFKIFLKCTFRYLFIWSQNHPTRPQGGITQGSTFRWKRLIWEFLTSIIVSFGF